MITRKVNVEIKNTDGTIVFQKDNFEVPEFWSDRAATIMASKYAMDNENSALQIIDRVVEQIGIWGWEQNYFDTLETDAIGFKNALRDILINQRAAFNSPVWFNCGSNTGTNQMSACFILPVEDTMESILEHYKTEGMIFRGGSGSGINISKLRGRGEKLSNKGESSGPVSFMRGWDSNAGTIKSGGKVRRAAKLVCMDVDHPDIFEFIECKKKEEDKAKVLIAAGISKEEAYNTVAFQNTNHSIRVTDSFMKAYKGEQELESSWSLINRSNKEETKVSARAILNRTAEIAWETGDPGIQFDDRMNYDNPVPSMGRINSTNPCSEFSAIDNSSCNLASLNLIKYLNKDNSTINHTLFQKDIRTMITAMDILVDAADYPTESIANTTKATRPLGLGFSNLGAVLMIMGHPYDSKEAREFASSVTKSMTTYAYMQSIMLAKRKGPYQFYKENEEINLNLVMRLTDTDETDLLWQGMKEHGLRNSQVTLLAPTGTISFMMDCDSTGIEPLFALKAYKQLSGGGILEIEPDCVKKAKKEYGDEIENLFDTANDISWKGHINMMAVCQKHLNGAISKTVNMPSSCTDKDIRDAYVYAWKTGLKALAIYRDGSKGMQPLTDSKNINKEEKKETHIEIPEQEGWSAFRRKLPETRQSITHKFCVGGLDGYLTIGMYEDGSPGEIFIRTQKQGSTMQGVLDAFATAVSLALQYGVPIDTMVDKFVGSKFEPAGFTPNEDIRFTSSVMDYIFRWIQLNFMDEEETYNHEVHEPSIIPPKTEAKFDGPPCNSCGSVTSRSGTCYLCTSCGETTGCS